MFKIRREAFHSKINVFCLKNLEFGYIARWGLSHQVPAFPAVFVQDLEIFLAALRQRFSPSLPSRSAGLRV
jgi:hypothetical protein